MEYISPEGLRQDGRRPKELRQLACQFGVLAKADGSAMFEMGNTKVSTGMLRDLKPGGLLVCWTYAQTPRLKSFRCWLLCSVPEK